MYYIYKIILFDLNNVLICEEFNPSILYDKILIYLNYLNITKLDYQC